MGRGGVKDTVIIGTSIFLVSLCASFILLYLYMPQRVVVQEAIALTPSLSISLPLDHSPPAKLTIGDIGVLTDVIPTGLTSDGKMDISDDAESVAWYQLGVKPGEVGSAVIAGHYGWKNGVPSVFNDLNKLKVGDKIGITKNDGMMELFVVSRTAIYTPDQDATEVFTSKDDKAHLNLITCQGDWNRGQATYSERLVVFTESIKNQ